MARFWSQRVEANVVVGEAIAEDVEGVETTIVTHLRTVDVLRGGESQVS